MRDRSLIDITRRRAAETPAAVAYAFLQDGEAVSEQLRFAELDERARAIATALQQATSPGERVLLAFAPGLEFVTAFLGCQYAGLVAVPTSPPRLDRIEATASRLSTIAADARPAVALTSADLLQPLKAATRGRLDRTNWLATGAIDSALATEWREPEFDGASLSFLQYTSGSTAAPRGVMISHDNLMANLRMLRETAKLEGRYNLVGWLPLFHDMGLIGVMLHGLYVGGETRLMSPLAFLKHPIRWLRAIAGQERVFSGGPNFAFDLCLSRISEAEAAGLDLREWRVVFSGAETVRAQTFERFYRAFAGHGLRREALLPCYGLAEATLVVSARTPGRCYQVASLDAEALERGLAVPADDHCVRATVVSCGSSKGEQEIAIVDPKTRERCPDLRVGEVWVRGPNVAAGYWGEPGISAETFMATTAAGEGPFMRTGDLGFVEADELYITGRIKEIIVVRGRCLYPQDIEVMVESMVARFPAIRPGDSVAFALTGAQQEGVGLIVQVRSQGGSGAEFQALVEALQQRFLAEFDVGFGEVALIKSAIPKTSSGKKMRLACSRMLASRADELTVLHRWRRADLDPRVSSDGALAGDDDPDRGRVRDIVALVTGWIAREERIDPARIEPTHSLADLGLDSLAAVSLIEFLEEELAITIPSALIQEQRTIGDFARALSRAG